MFSTIKLWKYSDQYVKAKESSIWNKISHLMMRMCRFLYSINVTRSHRIVPTLDILWFHASIILLITTFILLQHRASTLQFLYSLVRYCLKLLKHKIFVINKDIIMENIKLNMYFFRNLYCRVLAAITRVYPASIINNGAPLGDIR